MFAYNACEHVVKRVQQLQSPRCPNMVCTRKCVWRCAAALNRLCSDRHMLWLAAQMLYVHCYLRDLVNCVNNACRGKTCKLDLAVLFQDWVWVWLVWLTGFWPPVYMESQRLVCPPPMCFPTSWAGARGRPLQSREGNFSVMSTKLQLCFFGPLHCLLCTARPCPVK